MNVAFVLNVEVDTVDPMQVGEMASDIHSAMLQAGFDVTSVDPYNRPSLGVDLPGTDNPLSLG